MGHKFLKINEIWFALIKLIKLNLFGCKIKKHDDTFFSIKGKKNLISDKVFIKEIIE